MDEHSPNKHREIVEIYLPTVSDTELGEAEAAKHRIRTTYGMTMDDCLSILHLHMQIFDRLMRIDPVLRRPRPGSTPFATRLNYTTKEGAKRSLRRIHDCFNKYQIPSHDRIAYLRARTLQCFRIYHRVQARVERQLGRPVFQ